jgi:hypothetical protein
MTQLVGRLAIRVARFYLVTTYQNGKKTPNDPKIYLMAGANIRKCPWINQKHAF